jgi:hypothetical protein
MVDALKLLAWFVGSLFRSSRRLEAEIVILRHQLNVLRRRMPSRARVTLIDRLIFVWLYRLRPSMLNAVVIVQPRRWCDGTARASAYIGAGSLAHAAVAQEPRASCAVSFAR